MTKLEDEIEALKLENVALKTRLSNVEGAQNVLSKRILTAIDIISKGNSRQRNRVA